MNLDLSTINFSVNTKPLEAAAAAIGELVTNVGKLDKAAKDATIINELSQLKALAFADYAETKIDLIREEKTKLHQENNRVASEYKLNTEAIQLQNNELSGLEANLKLLNEQAVSSEQLLQEIQKNIAELLKIHHFDSLESVQTFHFLQECLCDIQLVWKPVTL